MAVLTTYKGLDIVEGATGAGGIALTDNFKKLANRAPFESTSNPGASNDSSQGYAVGDQWLNTSTQVTWVCTSAAVGAAVWKSFYRRTSTGLDLIPSETSERVSIVGGLAGGFEIGTPGASAPNQSATLTKFWQPRTSTFNNGWALDYQDEFALIDRKPTVSVSVTPTQNNPSSFPKSNLFQDDTKYIGWTGSPGPIEIIVDCSGPTPPNPDLDLPISPKLANVFCLGLTNRTSNVNSNPTNVKIDVWDPAGAGSWVNRHDLATQMPAEGAWVSPAFGGTTAQLTISKVRVTLTMPASLAVEFRLQRLMLYHVTAAFDPWHLHVLGGTLYGPLTLSAITAPSTPASGVVLYQDSANKGLFATFDNGRVARVASYAGVVTKTAAYTIASGDEVVLCNGSFTVTLPSAVGLTGRQFTIKRINATGNVTIATTSSQTIDDATTRVLAAQYDVARVVSDGANWWVV